MPSRATGKSAFNVVTSGANNGAAKFTDNINAEASVPPVNTEIEQFTTVEDFDYYIEDIRATGYDIDANGYNDSDGNRLKMLPATTNNITGILGMPYQWDPSVDLPLRDTEESDDGYGTVGRKFADKILSTMPILFLTPGEPKFMALSDNDSKMDLGREMLRGLGGLDSFLNSEDYNFKDGTENRYYSFSANFDEYSKYVNASCRAVLFYLGLQDIEIPIPGTTKTKRGAEFMIQDFMSNDFTKSWGSQATLPFFVDAETSISEDYSNSTTESMLASTANGFSQTARELRFIMGDNAGASDLMKSLGNTTELLTDNIGNAVKDIGEAFAGKNMLTRIANEITTIVKGGKIIFPEIWSDSSYSRSYNVNLKFRSPDPDPVSIFLNVYLPILALINMGAPRQLNNSANSYESPFICRATYKSIFSCDMAMIESISITRGGEDKWNIMGMPLSADVSLTLKDLYGSMFVSKGLGLVNNTIQMDYLASLAGIDLNEYEPMRIAQLAISLADGTWNTAIEALGFKIKQEAARFTAGIGKKVIPFYDSRASALGH